tara:strand:+ start:5152 stop:7275 length:2124 start_codon:yes stop_codon:yes gene_type:complete
MSDEGKEKTNEELEKEVKLRERLAELSKERKDDTEEQLRAIREYSKILGDVKEQREANLDLAKIEMLQALENSDALSGIEDQEKRRTELLKEIDLLLQGEASSLSDIDVITKSIGEEKLKQLQTDYQISEGQKKYGKNQKKLLNDLTGALGISNTLGNSFIGTLIKVNEELKSGGDAAKLAFVENFRQSFSVLNLMLSVIAKIAEGTIKTALEADKAQAAFASATGAGRAFADQIQDAGQEALGFGVSMEDAGKAAQTLFGATTNFVNVSSDMQKKMIANTAELEKIGVSAQSAAEIFQFMNLNLGLTAEESLKTTNQLAMLGTELGISSEKITKDFTQSMGTLAVYGPRAVTVFKNLAGAAKTAGVETSKLLSIAGKFDTFQSSAETVGKLNALLGTQLSTTQMLMMTEDERIETLISSVQAQGVAFKDMDRFQQKAIAAAAGIDDLNEAQRIFGMSLGQYQEAQAEMDENAAAQEKLTEALRGTQTITNKLKAIAAEFIVEFQPVLEMLHDMASAALDFLKQFSPEQKRRFVEIIAKIAGLVVVAKLLIPVISAITTIMGVVGGAGVAGGVGMIGGLTGMGAAAVAAAVPLAKLALILGGLYLAYKAFSGIGSLFEAGPEPSQAEKEAEGIIKYKSQVTPAVSADLANLALISAGKAKSAMQNAFVTAQKINITNNLEGLFPDNLQLVLNDGTKFNAHIAKVANG